MIYNYEKDKLEELVAVLQEDDIVQIAAADFVALTEKHLRKSGAGRKPIKPDEEIFIKVIERWQRGEITARAAMEEVNLKPNTFYRRVKELTEMTDIKKELKEAVKEEKKELKELKAQVKAEAKETKAQLKADAREAKDTISAKKMEKEILKEKLEAEVDRAREIKELEKEVKAETKEFKTAN